VGGFDETIFISQCNTAVDKDDLSNAREFARGFLGDWRGGCCGLVQRCHGRCVFPATLVIANAGVALIIFLRRRQVN
jgi:hypothetical protein